VSLPPTARLSVNGAMLSHPGLVRELNEDVVIYRVPTADDPVAHLGMMAVVADGMGGHAAGEVASQIAAQTLLLLYYQQDRPVPQALAEGIAAANKVIYEHGRENPECTGMGTTCTVLVIRDDQAWIGHVGDSRAYIVRDGTIHQLSKDHSLVAQLVEDGTLTSEEACVSPDRNVLLRALGTRPTVEPYLWNEGMSLLPSDVFVLCSDGLCDLVDNAQIIEAVTRHAPFEACETLIDAALAAGGHDNISVGVFAVMTQQTAPTAIDRPTRNIDLAALSGGLG
jgi:serine/threonine protein phosphatase PrpC